MALRGPLAQLYDESAESSLPSSTQSRSESPPAKSYKNITVNLPMEILSQLEHCAYHQRKKKNAIVREALEAYFRSEQ